MSDDLIKRLGSSCYLAFEDGTNDYSAAQEAIDRIEELERSRKDLEKLSIKLLNEKLRGEWREPLVAELEAAEAKLTKAVEAMRNTLDKPRDADQSYAGLWADTIKEVRATLAELEGKEEATGTAWRGRE